MEDLDLAIQTTEETFKKLKTKDFDSYEVTSFIRDHTLTRFANDVIHQQVSSNALRVKIRAIKGDKLSTITGTAYGNDIDKIIDDLVTNIDFAPSLPYLQGFAEDQAYEKVNAMGEILDATERAEIVSQSKDIAKDYSKHAKIFGKVETLNFYFAVMNSNGINGDHAFNFNDFKIMSIYEDGDHKGYGREVRVSKDRSSLDIEALAQSAVKISKDTAYAEKIEPGDYPVVLRPQAFLELLSYSLFGLFAQYFHQGNSPYTDKLGEQLLDVDFNLRDVPLDPSTIFASPMDGEGVAKDNRSIFDQGIPKLAFYNTLLASQYLDDKSLTTGHDLIPFSDYSFGGAAPQNLVFETGNSIENEMIRDTQEGLLVQTFWYSNPVNMPKGIITGLTRDGLYLIKDGEIKHAVRNMRYTDSLLSFFKDIESIGKKQYSVMSDGTAALIPEIKLNKLKFTGQSKH